MKPEIYYTEAEIMSTTQLARVKEAWFLEALAEDGNVSRAATAAGFDRKTAYRRRGTDPKFAEAWDNALAIAADRLEAEALRRAVQGVTKPLYYQGQPVYLYRTVVDENNQPVLGEDGRELREVVRDAEGQPVQAVEYIYSDSLLTTMLRGAKPEKYRDNKSTVEVSGPGGGAIELTAVSETERARRIAFTLQQGLIAAQQGTVVSSQEPEAEFEADGGGDEWDPLV